MIIKTRHYRLDKKIYRSMAMRNVLSEQWWVALIVVALCLGYLWLPSLWWFIGAATGGGLYLLFWWIQFYGVTQMEQGKLLFERLSYEINSRQILIKRSAKEGMPIQWERIKRAKIGEDHFFMSLNKAQLIYLPFKIFRSENERKFLKSVLKNKGLIK